MDLRGYGAVCDLSALDKDYGYMESWGRILISKKSWEFFGISNVNELHRYSIVLLHC